MAYEQEVQIDSRYPLQLRHFLLKFRGRCLSFVKSSDAWQEGAAVLPARNGIYIVFLSMLDSN